MSDQTIHDEMIVPGAPENIDEPPSALKDFTLRKMSPQTPGYLGKLRTVLRWQEGLTSGDLTTAEFDAMIEFILGFVVAPGQETARDVILNVLTAEEIGRLMAAIQGRAVPPA